MTDVRLTATNPEDSSVVPVSCNARGELLLEEPIAPPEFDGNLNGDLTVTGEATFANGRTELKADGTAEFRGPVSSTRNSDTQSCFEGNRADTPGTTSKIRADGSVDFAGGAAGFTSSGHLFCTTLRGDLVVLENTSGGFGAWVEYERSTRVDQLAEKLEEWDEKDKLRPSDRDPYENGQLRE